MRFLPVASVLLAASSSQEMFQSRSRLFISAFSHHSKVGRSFIRNPAATLSSTAEDIEWSTDKVRSTFVDYFVEKNDHTSVPSSACAPLNDPTLLFANAGMNQFKPIFLGQADPNSAMATWKRAANSQKCIRAGGKHNDLDDVGRDTYHHTFFEMLGSWSFGDYFKKEAIDYAWDLLIEVYGIDPERVYATYFEGDESLGLEADNEAKEFWLKYLPESRIIGCNAKDNFWEMGETGPCGPCSEVHYDRVGNRDAAALVNADDPDVIEIWNIVFIQYNRDEKGLSTLPDQHIDTGMGLERLVSLLQDKSSNYDIDAFQPIFRAIEEQAKVGKYTGLVLEADTTLKDTAYRAIADHARTLSFAIADGVVPSNEGRGYVLRRILRRAARYGQQILNCEPGFFVKLIPSVVDTFGDYYPELVKNQDLITEIVNEEEAAFSTMLVRGITFFAELEETMKEDGSNKVAGDKAFYLYDTLGFPIDLTEQMAEEAGFTVDSDGFKNEMEIQKQRSRDARNAAKSGGAKRLELIAEQTAWLANNEISTTDDESKFEWDVSASSSITAIYAEEGFLEAGSKAQPGDNVGLILEKSAFYAESGGQEADIGSILIKSSDGETGKFNVIDVQVFGGYLLHTGTIEEGEIEVGSVAECKVDYERRRDIAPNHSMTHVLNGALRQVLGDGVDQRGSLCNDEKLRFDFSNKKALSSKQLRKVEELCQQSIASAEEVTSEVMPLADAQALDGVRAVFGEVYPDPVRVVSIGSDTSVEFCGGIHLSNIAEAEAFALVEETAVAKGVRRITAVTKGLAAKAIAEGANFEKKISEVEELPAETDKLDKTAGALRKDLDEGYMSAVLKAQLRARIESVQKKAVDAKKRALAQRVDKVLNVVKEQLATAAEDGVKSLVLSVDIGADSKASQKVMNAAKSIAPEMAFMGLSEEEEGSGGKLLAFASVPDALVDSGLKADEWVRATLEVCGGRGGGRPSNAQGQAPECTNVDEVIAACEKFVADKIGAAV
mmetsp:Transcript_19641/g.28904  ORF Transcript_19641/g.28904 Transcript_19641/m.28904 type:complete len:1006 (-) Transcript_19641:88-3105(-)